MPRSIKEQVEKTYFSLRIAAAVIGFAFPWVLLVGGCIWGHFGMRDSMSAYYHANPKSLVACDKPCKPPTPADNEDLPQAGTMRDAFVGMLFALGTVLYVNKGHTKYENIALNLAGVFAICIAIFPMPWTCKPPGSMTMHGASAILFFVCIALISVVFSGATLQYLPPKKRRWFKAAYIALACMMIASPAAASIFNEMQPDKKNYLFAVEFFGIYAFGLYWVVKTKEISILKKLRDARSEGGVLEAIPGGEAGVVEIPKDIFL